MIKVCIPYCEHRGIDGRVVEFVNTLPRDKFHISTCCGHFVDWQRNAMVNDAKSDMAHQTVDTKYSHLLFLDSDNRGTLEQIEHLISLDLPVVSAAYARRQDQGQYVAGYWGQKSGLIGSFIEAKDDGLRRLDWVGMGFCLVKSEVFNKMIYPWFEPIVVEFEGRRALSRDDAGFCWKCERIDVPVYVDTSTVVEHFI